MADTPITGPGAPEPALAPADVARAAPAPEEFYVLADTHAHAADAPSADADHGAQEEGEHAHDSGTILGFWLYLMSDCLIFGILFAVHAVLGQNYAAGPAPKDLFEIELILLATFVLLFSSITFGFAMQKMHENNVKGMTLWLAITGALGLAFLGLEIKEFLHLWHVGATPMASAFLSSFWLLVGTHGLHVLAGCMWLTVLLVQVGMHGLTPDNKIRLMCLSLFWHFLDLIWIGVFSFVYLTGVLL